MKKKVLALFLAFTACVGAFGLVACDDEATGNTIPPVVEGSGDPSGDEGEGEQQTWELEYEFTNDYPYGEAYAVMGIGTATEVKDLVIPSTYNNYPVKFIAANAFEHARNLQSVVIPDTVVRINSSAFLGCTALTNVVIPDSVTTLGKYAFRRCYDLKSVTIGDGLQTIDEYTFYECTDLTTVVIGAGIQTIVDFAFEDCENISTVYYKGTPAEWNDVSVDLGKNMRLVRATRYYYSETAVTDNLYAYWHYVSDTPTPWN